MSHDVTNVTRRDENRVGVGATPLTPVLRASPPRQKGTTVVTTDAVPTPADAGAPRVELSRTKDGTRTWRVVVQAGGSSEEALTFAQNVAMTVDAAFEARYRHPAAQPAS
jgi:hypothetical protein